MTAIEKIQLQMDLNKLNKVCDRILAECDVDEYSEEEDYNADYTVADLARHLFDLATCTKKLVKHVSEHLLKDDEDGSANEGATTEGAGEDSRDCD